MAKTNVAPVAGTGPYPSQGTNYAFVACDAVNGNRVRVTGRTLFLFRNVGNAARTVDFDSAPDEKGRTGDIALSLAASGSAGDEKLVGPLPLNAWVQGAGADAGYITFTASHADVEVLAISIS